MSLMTATRVLIPIAVAFGPKVLQHASPVDVNSLLNFLLVLRSNVELPSVETIVEVDGVTPEEYADFGRRVAAYTTRAAQGRVHAAPDEGLLWHQIHRCFDWRRQWDYEWSHNGYLEKLKNGGSRWQNGEHWDVHTSSAREGMKRIPPAGIPSLRDFRVKHDDAIGVRTNPDHSLYTIIYTAGALCDKLEFDIPGPVKGLKIRKNSERRDPRAVKVFKDVLPHCLVTCGTQLGWLVAPLRRRGQMQGEEKIKYANWLGQQARGVVLSDEQVAEIKHAIIKGRPHKAKKEEVYAHRAIMTGQPNVIETTGPTAASTSGQRYHAPPKHAPPAPLAQSHVASQGANPVARGAAKRVRSGTRSLVPQNSIGASAQDPFLPIVQRERNEGFVPIRRNPNADIRLQHNPVRNSPNIPARSMSPVRNPPGQWVPPGRIQDPRNIRAAAAALPWADDRGRGDLRALMLYERVPAAPVDYEQAVWSHLERAWVYPFQIYTPDGEYCPRPERSRSPPPFRPRRHKYPYGGHRDFDVRYPDEHGNRGRDPYDAAYQQQYDERYRCRGAW